MMLDIDPLLADEPIIRNMVSPPLSGEPPIDFPVLVDAARAALPPGFPTDPARVLVALDLDGTVMTLEGVSDRVRAVLADATDAGIHVVIATGRSLEATGPVLDQLGGPDAWAVCSNGAITAHFSQIHEGGARALDPLTFDASGLIDLVLEQIPGALVGVEAPGDFLLSGDFPAGELIEEHRVVPVEDLRGVPAIKLVVRAPEMTRSQFEDVLVRLGVPDRWECSVGWTSWADLLPLGVTKASGLEALAARLGVPREGTVAIGDGTNDVSMIRWAALGVAMGSASADIKACADLVTGAVENEGAAAVIRAVLDHCGGALP
ncbi:Cof-type HAD-IIB family hydrolase [Actinomyces sp. B33]|uniref:HAD hydrolase family protein n=1 Tax=Actinomyces sp. B33 TaxID=2942131 RepID=UPI002340BE0D|nr:HAD family hydrolase [Actinomyces sp. B33]MDC4233405.1 Cof-type HAD-IIB family hydrolase [Actinomyces sp. B33]